MPPTPKANYKTYEAQARLVRAMVAAHPEVRWNYKEITLHYGSDMTEHALNHRFRPIKKQVKLVREAVKKGKDAATISIDKEEISKFYGESTADGMQFQFRTIKKDADAMKTAVSKGTDPRKAISIGPGSSSLSRSAASKAPATGSGRGRGKKTASTPSSDSEPDNDDDDEVPDDTPTKPPRSKVAVGRITKPAARTAAPRVATAAPAARGSTTVDLTASESEIDTPQAGSAAAFFANLPPPEDIKPSIFGGGAPAAPAPAAAQPQQHRATPVVAGGLGFDPFNGPSSHSAPWMNSFMASLAQTSQQPVVDDEFDFDRGYGADAMEDEC